MSIEETYDWAKQVSKDFEVMASRAEDVGALNNELTNGGDHPVHTANFVSVTRDSFLAEVGRVDGSEGQKGEDLVFHFFPAPSEKYSLVSESDADHYYFPDDFPEALGSAFVEVFKQEEKLCWDFVPEMNSWVVRCQGYGANLMANQLAEKLFDDLCGRLEQ